MHSKKGFTLLEVALFLALSGVLIIGIIAGTTRSIAAKRFEDTTNNFISYLEDLYSSVNYVRNNTSSDPGRSDQAVYGKLINMVYDKNAKTTTFSSYSVIGNADANNIRTSDALEALTDLSPKIIAEATSEYQPSWGGWIQGQEGEKKEEKDLNGNQLQKDPSNQVLLLIIRHPQNGMSSTYVNFPSSEVKINDLNNVEKFKDFLKNFSKKDANFCVDSNDRWAGGDKRRLVRIYSGANNASGVELIGDEAAKKEGLCEYE